MPEWLFPVMVTAAASGLVTWGAVRAELRYLRRDVDAAHTRLDRINAPSGWGSHQGERP